jgi:hypothetical protein
MASLPSLSLSETDRQVPPPVARCVLFLETSYTVNPVEGAAQMVFIASPAPDKRSGHLEETRMPDAADKEAARALIARQKFCTDDRDLAGVGECWARDGRLELRVNGGEPVAVTGREAILDFVAKGWARPSDHPHVHLITTLEIIDRDDGGLGAESYCAYLSTTAPFHIEGYGRYSDVLTFEEGAWRLLSRSVRITAAFQPGAAPARAAG